MGILGDVHIHLKIAGTAPVFRCNRRRERVCSASFANHFRRIVDQGVRVDVPAVAPAPFSANPHRFFRRVVRRGGRVCSIPGGVNRGRPPLGFKFSEIAGRMPGTDRPDRLRIN